MTFKSRVNWKHELPVIKELGSLGWTQTQLAVKYGVTKQRIKQVVDRHIPDWNQNYGHAVNRKMELESHFARWGVKEDSDLYRSKRSKFRSKKYQALANGNSWDLDFGDLNWPTHCPVLGIELDYFAEFRQENSPSFDQTEPGKGYVRGNVQIVSWRANRLKNNGTADEHRRIAEYIDSLSSINVDRQE